MLLHLAALYPDVHLRDVSSKRDEDKGEHGESKQGRETASSVATRSPGCQTPRLCAREEAKESRDSHCTPELLGNVGTGYTNQLPASLSCMYSACTSMRQGRTDIARAWIEVTSVVYPLVVADIRFCHRH